MIDTHAHLLREYYPDGAVSEVLSRGRAAGVTDVVQCATRSGDWDEVVALAVGEPDVWAAVGVHPHDASELFPDPRPLLRRLRELLRLPRVVAVGECGLDYHYDHSPREQQREALRLHIRLAIELKKPLVLHNRESDDDLVSILQEEGAGRVGGVVHAFAAGEAIARRCLDLGFHLGFGGMVTFKTADPIRATLRSTPIDRILLETDSPYLTPAPHRGQRNEPAYVSLVARRVAAELRVAPEEVVSRTTANARRLFGLVAT